MSCITEIAFVLPLSFSIPKKTGSDSIEIFVGGLFCQLKLSKNCNSSINS